jgi:hypothetical protein
MDMKVSHISLLAVLLVATAVIFAGCSGTSPAAPSADGTPAPGISPSGSTATPSGGAVQTTGASSPGSAGTQAAAVSGADLFGNLNYNWVEYKTTTGTGSEAMTIYMKYNRLTGKCTMRFEGAAAAQMPPGMQEMDCSAQGATRSDPNQVSSDAKVDCSLLDESVTVPAGTFSATKCTVTSKDGTVGTAWIARGKFMVRMEASTGQGSTTVVLNAYG